MRAIFVLVALIGCTNLVNCEPPPVNGFQSSEIGKQLTETRKIFRNALQSLLKFVPSSQKPLEKLEPLVLSESAPSSAKTYGPPAKSNGGQGGGGGGYAGGKAGEVEFDIQPAISGESFFIPASEGNGGSSRGKNSGYSKPTSSSSSGGYTDAGASKQKPGGQSGGYSKPSGGYSNAGSSSGPSTGGYASKTAAKTGGGGGSNGQWKPIASAAKSSTISGSSSSSGRGGAVSKPKAPVDTAFILNQAIKIAEGFDDGKKQGQGMLSFVKQIFKQGAFRSGSGSMFSPPSATKGGYSTLPNNVQQSYGTPSAPNPPQSYGTLESSYGTPSNISPPTSGGYSTLPKTPASDYGTPSGQYGSPSFDQSPLPQDSYGPPQQFTAKLQQQYVKTSPPLPAQSQSQYGAPGVSPGEPIGTPESSYGAPTSQRNAYGPPGVNPGEPIGNETPQTKYGTPASSYGTPEINTGGYSAPSAPSGGYESSSSSGGYSAPAASSGGYSAPVTSGYSAPLQTSGGYSAPDPAPNGGYSAPASSSSSYSAPASSSGGYSAPSAPSGSYSAPASSSGGYSAPSAPSGGYSAPAASSGGYSAPGPAPSGGYEAPSSSDGYSGPAPAVELVEFHTGYEASSGGYAAAPSPSSGGYNSPAPQSGGYDSPPAPSGGYSAPASSSTGSSALPSSSGGYSAPASSGGYEAPSSGGYDSPPPSQFGGYGSPSQPKEIFIDATSALSHSPQGSSSYGPQTEPEHTQIIFVKAPTPPKILTEVQLPPPQQTETKVYVLTKQPEEMDHNIRLIQPNPTKAAKPEVFFIRYAQNAPKEPQSEFNRAVPLNEIPLPVQSFDQYAPQMTHSSYTYKREAVQQPKRIKKKVVYTLKRLSPTIATSN